MYEKLAKEKKEKDESDKLKKKSQFNADHSQKGEMLIYFLPLNRMP